MKAAVIGLGVIGVAIGLLWGLGGDAPLQPDTATEETDVSPPQLIIAGKGFELRLPAQWRRVTPSPPLPWLTREAITFAGPEGCFGAIMRRPRAPRRLLSYGPGRVTTLGLKQVRTLYGEKVLYNDTTTYRIAFSGEHEATTWRFQLTILPDTHSYTELLAWSRAPGIVARTCHDMITARFTWAPTNAPTSKQGVTPAK